MVKFYFLLLDLEYPNKRFCFIVSAIPSGSISSQPFSPFIIIFKTVLEKISKLFLSKSFCKMHVCVYLELLINVCHVQARAHEYLRVCMKK